MNNKKKQKKKQMWDCVAILKQTRVEANKQINPLNTI